MLNLGLRNILIVAKMRWIDFYTQIWGPVPTPFYNAWDVMYATGMEDRT